METTTMASSSSSNRWEQLPPGWSTVVSQTDGRMYYWEQSTGRTSWIHPLAASGQPHDAPVTTIQPITQQTMSQPPPPPPLASQTTANANAGASHFVPIAQATPAAQWWNPFARSSNEQPRHVAGATPYLNATTVTTTAPQQQHQQLPPPPPPYSTRLLDTPYNATRRPESHQCYAVVALLLCFPFGVCACIHSHNVDEAWKDGRYGDAVNHSRQAKNYANFGCLAGAIFWVYWIFFSERGGNRWEWPNDWNLFD